MEILNTLNDHFLLSMRLCILTPNWVLSTYKNSLASSERVSAPRLRVVMLYSL